MKIALYGNVCNNMFAICRTLRNHSFHEAHLYLPQNTNFHNLPENDYPQLKDNYPHWIHRSKDYNLGSVFQFWKSNIIKELNKYDVVILSSLAIGLSPLLWRPKILFFVTGADLTVLPFKDIHRTVLYGGKRNNIKPVLYQLIQRSGIKKVDKLLIQPFFPFVNAVNKLAIPASKILESYFPVIIDTENFKYRPNTYFLLSENTQKQLDRFSFRVFSPTRIMMNKHPHMVETGQCKGTDLLIRSFAEFLKKTMAQDAGLYLIERSYNANSELLSLQKLIIELNIQDHIVWLKPEKSNHGFTRDELINIYSCCDLIADEFCAGWFGSICIEAFSCSKPVLSYVDEAVMMKIYPWHPFLSSLSIDENTSFIQKCYQNKFFAKTQGELGRKWALEFHSPRNAGKLYLRELEKIFAKP